MHNEEVNWLFFDVISPATVLPRRRAAVIVHTNSKHARFGEIPRVNWLMVSTFNTPTSHKCSLRGGYLRSPLLFMPLSIHNLYNAFTQVYGNCNSTTNVPQQINKSFTIIPNFWECGIAFSLRNAGLQYFTWVSAQYNLCISMTQSYVPL